MDVETIFDGDICDGMESREGKDSTGVFTGDVAVGSTLMDRTSPGSNFSAGSL